MKFYLAGRYSKREQLKWLAAELRRMGHTVTARWLETGWVNRPDQSSAAPPEYRQKYALIDLEDVAGADVVVSLTEGPGEASRGGRHVEFGYALALGKKLVVIGYRENLFHEHPAVEFHTTQFSWLSSLAPVGKEGA